MDLKREACWDQMYSCMADIKCFKCDESYDEDALEQAIRSAEKKGFNWLEASCDEHLDIYRSAYPDNCNVRLSKSLLDYVHCIIDFEVPSEPCGSILKTYNEVDVSPFPTEAPLAIDTGYNTPFSASPTASPTDIITFQPIFKEVVKNSPVIDETEEDESFYTVEFKSVFIGQTDWEESEMNEVFISVVDQVACNSITDSSSCAINIKQALLGLAISDQNRLLQSDSASQAFAVEVSFEIIHIHGSSNAIIATNNIIASSNNNELLNFLKLETDLVSATQIITVSVGEPVLEESDSSGLDWIVIIGAVGGILFLGCLSYLLRRCTNKRRLHRSEHNLNANENSRTQHIDHTKSANSSINRTNNTIEGNILNSTETLASVNLPSAISAPSSSSLRELGSLYSSNNQESFVYSNK